MDWKKVGNWLVTGYKEVLPGVQSGDLWAHLFELLAFFFVLILSVKIAILSEV